MISRSMVAVGSAACGACVALLVFAVLRPQDQQLVAAEQRFRELPPADARRIQATFERLQNAPEDRAHIQSIHAAVEENPTLKANLDRVYQWWSSCTADVRANLREFRSTPHRWVDEVERQMSEAETDVVIVILPSPPERGRGGRRVRVALTPEQVDRFLDAAVPDEELTDADRRLLDEVQDSDFRLAQVLVTLRSLFDFRSERPEPDQRQVQRVFRAAAQNILPDHVPDRGGNPRQDAIVCFSVLKSLSDQLAQGFVERHQVADADIEQLFAAMKPSDRIPPMLSEPQEITRKLSAALNAQQLATPAGQLARQLDRLNQISSRLRQINRIRAVRGDGPGRGFGREFEPNDRDRREFRGRRGPGGRGPDGPPPRD